VQLFSAVRLSEDLCVAFFVTFCMNRLDHLKRKR
jgi:hypothetical protein